MTRIDQARAQSFALQDVERSNDVRPDRLGQATLRIRSQAAESAMFSQSSVEVTKLRTGCRSRSSGTTAYTFRSPTLKFTRGVAWTVPRMGSDDPDR